MHVLGAKARDVDRMAFALVHKFLVVPIPQCLRWADLGAPRLHVLARAIVAEITLLHQASAKVKLGYTKGTGVDAVAAANAAGWISLLHDTFRCDQNSHHRTHLSAGGQWVLTMHT